MRLTFDHMNKKSAQNIRIGFVGDVSIMHSAHDELMKDGPEEFSRKIWAPLMDCDLIIANLEAPVTDHDICRDNKLYNCRLDRAVVDIFDERFVLTIANNHMMDFGDQGLQDTEAALSSAGIRYVGAGENQSSAGAPVIAEVKGVKVGVIGAADARSNPSSEDSAGTFLAELDTIESAINGIRSRVDIVIVTVHAGIEFISAPSPFQVAFANACRRAGADIVQYHHAHCISGAVRDENCLILYGTGNYVFPNLLPAGFKAWHRTAAWVTEVNARDGIASSDIRSLTIDKLGIPRLSTDKERQYTLKLVQRYNRRIRNKKLLALWRIAEFINPVYVRLCLVQYAAMTKSSGIGAVIKAIRNGIVYQFKTD